MGEEERKRNRRIDIQADLFLENGKVLNVYSGEILDANVAVKGEKIRYVGPRSDDIGDQALRLDMAHKLLVPGYIEPHTHPWCPYDPITLGEEASRLGTTTLVCDDLLFYILMGAEGFESSMEALSSMPIKFFWFIRLVPQTPLENEEELFSKANLERILRNPWSLSVGEITRWQDLIKGDPKMLSCIEFARRLRKRIDGHTAGAKYEYLNAIAERGVESCHESITPEEVLDRLRLGFHVMLRQSSLRPDLRSLLKAVRENPSSTRRAMLTTDGPSPSQFENGMTDWLLRIAMEEGIDPVEAYRMVTINPAAYFGLEHLIGGIAPGRDADILVLDDLHHPTPEMVISKGRIIAEKTVLLRPFPKVEWNRYLSETSHIRNDWRAKADFFEIPCTDKSHGQTISFPVAKLVNAVITRVEEVEFPLREGFIDVSSREGFCWVSTLNKHGRWVANGIVRGFADQIDGIASTFNTATEIVVIGRNPGAMALAVNRVLEMKGGIAAIQDGKPVFELPLPIGGQISDRPMKELAEKDTSLREFLSRCGHPFHDPLYTFIFLPNDFLPEVRINRRGVVNIKTNEVLWPPRRLI